MNKFAIALKRISDSLGYISTDQQGQKVKGMACPPESEGKPLTTDRQAKGTWQKPPAYVDLTKRKRR